MGKLKRKRQITWGENTLFEWKVLHVAVERMRGIIK